MLGLTSYQEALRALGRQVEPATELRLVEHAEEGWLELVTPRGSRRIEAAELENIVMVSLAQRGELPSVAPSDGADVLRSVGLALDELHALDICIDLTRKRLEVHFVDQRGAPHALTYVGEELDALRRAAAARRSGQPLRRILILQSAPDSAANIAELLVAEFAVQTLPAAYARAVAATAEPPDLVLAQASDRTIEALQTLRLGERTAAVPLVVLAGPESDVSASQLFAAGADDLLLEPFQPAQLRARVRTWLLRGRPDL